MLFEESVWIAKRLRSLKEKGKLTQLLNFGSSTEHFRKVEQPFIHENIFKPIESDQIKVYHLDIKDSQGVDFAGNVFENKKLLNDIKTKQINTILCSNLLEHVPSTNPFFMILEELIHKNGYIIVTVPNLYPYHADPIDTMYRPSVEDIVSSFSNAKLIEGEIITTGQNHFQFLLKKPRFFLVLLIRIFTPFYKFGAWRKIISDLPNLFKKFRVTCVLLEINKQ